MIWNWLISVWPEKPELLYYLVEYNNEEVSVGATEDRDIHGDGSRVRLVEPHTEVPLSAEQEEDEDP